MIETFKTWIQKEIDILGYRKPRFFWILVSLISAICLTAFSLIFSADVGNQSLFYYGVIAISLVFVCIIFSIAIRPAYPYALIFVLIVSAVTFALEKYLFSGEVFATFSERTVISLWFSFGFLSISIFYKKIPLNILSVFPAILIFGAFVCISFILVLLPIMTFAWILIPFAGIGLLPYSPIIALSGFLLAFKHIYTYLKTDVKIYRFSQVYLIVTLLVVFGYSGWYAIEWGRCLEVVDAHSSVKVGHETIYNDLPSYIQLAMKFPVSHVSEQFLQPVSGNRNMTMQTGNVFDPLAFLVGELYPKSNLKYKDRVNLLRILFGYSHTELERLWSGDSIYTSSLQSHIQLYPEERISYTESTFEIKNTSDRQKEAIYTLKVPESSIATRLSLWINGVEEPARLTFKGRARASYKKIVGVERRDPSLLEWMPGGYFRLRVFPIPPKGKRMVRIGIISPLKKSKNSLIYTGLKTEGVPFLLTKNRVHVDLFSKDPSINLISSGLNLEKSIVSDGEIRQWKSEEKFNQDWSIKIKMPELKIPGGVFKIDSDSFSLSQVKFEKVSFIPDNIYIILSSNQGSQFWVDLYRKIRENSSAKIYFLTTKLFQSDDPIQVERYLNSIELPAFNLFPFYILEPAKKNLLIGSSEKYSLSFSDLKGSKFYEKNREYLVQKPEPVFYVSLDGRPSQYIQSFIELEKVRLLSQDENSLFNFLKTKSIELPENTNDIMYFSVPDFSLTRNNNSLNKAKTSGDFLARLFYYRLLMKKYGSELMEDEKSQSELFKLAEDGLFVSPITSLIVLESEKDYSDNKISKNFSKLGQTNITPPGTVPEPEEWFIILLLFLTILFVYRKKINLIRKNFL